MLTAREREILQLLADGMSNADVAAQALHQPGDGEEPRAAHPREARGRHAHARGRDRAARRDHRLSEPAEPPPGGGRASAAGERERIRLFEERIAQPSRTSAAGSRCSPRRRRSRALAGIALMLDAVDHAIAEAQAEDARRSSASALEQQRADDPLAPRSLVQHRAGRRSATRASSRLYARSPSGLGARPRQVRGRRGRRAGARRLAERAQVTLYQLDPCRAQPGSRSAGRASDLESRVADDDDGGASRCTVAGRRASRSGRRNGIEAFEERARHAERHALRSSVARPGRRSSVVPAGYARGARIGADAAYLLSSCGQPSG